MYHHHHHHHLYCTDLMSCSISGGSARLAMKTRPLLTASLLLFSIIVIIVNINIVVIVINIVITTIVFIAVSKCFCHWCFRDVWLKYSRIQRLEPTTRCGASWNRWAFWAIIVFKRINSILIWSIEIQLRNDTTLIWMKCPRSTRWPIQKTWWSKDETVERWKNHVADIFFVYS